MRDKNNNKGYASYSIFNIGDSTTDYTLFMCLDIMILLEILLPETTS